MVQAFVSSSIAATLMSEMVQTTTSASALTLCLLNLRHDSVHLELVHFGLILWCMMLSLPSSLGDKPFFFSQSTTDPVIRFYPWQTFWSFLLLLFKLHCVHVFPGDCSNALGVKRTATHLRLRCRLQRIDLNLDFIRLCGSI